MTDPRIEKIKEQLLKFTIGDFSERGDISDKGDDLDAITVAVNTLGEEIHSKGKAIANFENRITAIMDVLLKYTLMDFSEKADVSEAGDEIDAIAVGLNTLGEELESKIESERKYIQDLEKLAIVLETTADAITTKTPDGIYLTWNKSAERIYGYTAAEMVGNKLPPDFMPGMEEDSMKEAISRAAAGERVVDFHTKSKRKDGKIIDISITLTPILNSRGKVVSISGISRDITAQKKTEQALKDSEERFRLLVEEVSDYAIFFIDPKGNIVSWNKGAEKIKGYTSKEAIGKHISMFYTPEEMANNEPMTNLRLAAEKGRHESEGWRVKKDGTRFWADVVFTPLYDSQKNLRGFSKVTRDITERRNAEEKVKQLNRELELNVQRLEETNTELEAFTYSVSHDLRAPLRAIHGYTKVLSKDYEDKLDEDAHIMMNAVMNNAKKMGQLIDDLLALSRLGRKELTKREVDMTLLAEAVVGEFKRTNTNTDITIHPLPSAHADFSLITQVFTNLISNAVKYSSLKENPKVEIGAEKKDNEVVYYIKDNGAGFDMKYYNKLFGVFQRLHDAGEFEGTGVGLALVKRIISKHEGKVWAEAELGRGATFYFTLPS